MWQTLSSHEVREDKQDPQAMTNQPCLCQVVKFYVHMAFLKVFVNWTVWKHFSIMCSTWPSNVSINEFAIVVTNTLHIDCVLHFVWVIILWVAVWLHDGDVGSINCTQQPFETQSSAPSLQLISQGRKQVFTDSITNCTYCNCHCWDCNPKEVVRDLLDFVSRLHDDWVISYHVYMKTESKLQTWRPSSVTCFPLLLQQQLFQP